MHILPHRNKEDVPAFLARTLASVSVAIGATAALEAILKLVIGRRPQLDNTAALISYISHSSNLILGIVIVDSFLMMGLLVYFAVLRHILIKLKPSLELFANTAYGATLIFICLTLVGDAMDGATALDVMHMTPNAAIIRALTEGHVLLFGSIGSIVIAFIILSYTVSLNASGLINRWVSIAGYVFVVLDLLLIPSAFTGLNNSRFYSADGGVSILVGILPFIAWIVFSGLVISGNLIRRGRMA